MQKKQVQVSYSEYRDLSKAGNGRTVVEALILAEYGRSFLLGLDTIRRKCKPNESIRVSWWYAPFIYIEVIDSRYGEFPASLRFLVSFDLTAGTFASLRSSNCYECARKGWRKFAERFIGRRPTYYKSGEKFAPISKAV